MKAIFRLSLRNSVATNQIGRKRLTLWRRGQDPHFFDNSHALPRGLLVPSRALLNNHSRYEQLEPIGRRFPPFLGRDLARKHNHVPSWPSSKVTNDRRFDVNARFHGFQFPRIAPAERPGSGRQDR
jgi:hypothetical protein